MSETTVLLLAIVVAALAMGLWVALSLARAAPPDRPVVKGTAVNVLCPARGNLARVEIGFDPARGKLTVIRCQHFPTGVFECDRGCFPMLILLPAGEAGGSA